MHTVLIVGALAQRWTHLSTHTRGVKYSPPLPGVSPNLDAADLFDDKWVRYFERDVRVLHGMGANTLILEPQDVTKIPARFHQALFNASNFIFAEGDAEATHLPMRLQTVATPLRLVPGLDFSQSTLTEAATCARLREHARLLVTPEPNRSTAEDGYRFGGGAGHSKDNCAAIQLLPACTPKSLAMVGKMASCVKGVLPSNVSLLVGLAESESCNLIDALETHGSDWQNVTDGVVLQLSRSHSCDASYTIMSLVNAAANMQWGRAPPMLWFVIGVDAYDSNAFESWGQSLSDGEYPTVRTSAHDEVGTLMTVTDARTECLLSLIDSGECTSPTSVSVLSQ